MEIQLVQYPGTREQAFTGLVEQALVFRHRDSSLGPIQRNLAQAAEPDAPLLDRLRQLCAASSSLDEFFEAQAASLCDQRGGTGSMVTIAPDVESLLLQCRGLVERQYALLRQAILPGLSAAGTHLLEPARFNAAQRAWARQYFMREVRPLLTPIGLDPAHPFPQVGSKTLNFIVELGGRDAFGRGSRIAIMRAPRVLPRVIRMPGAQEQQGSSHCLLSSLIRAHIEELFAHRTVLACSPFRLTRNASPLAAPDDAADLSCTLPDELRRRLYGFPVRLELDASCPVRLSAFLLEQFGLAPNRLFGVDGPVNLVHLLGLDQLRPAASCGTPASTASHVAAGETNLPGVDERATIQF